MTPTPTKLEEAIDKGTRAALDKFRQLAPHGTPAPTELEEAIDACTEAALHNIMRVARGLKGQPLDENDVAVIRKIIEGNTRAAIQALLNRRQR